MLGGYRQRLKLRNVTEAGRGWVRRKQQLCRPKAEEAVSVGGTVLCSTFLRI